MFSLSAHPVTTHKEHMMFSAHSASFVSQEIVTIPAFDVQVGDTIVVSNFITPMGETRVIFDEVVEVWQANSSGATFIRTQETGTFRAYEVEALRTVNA